MIPARMPSTAGNPIASVSCANEKAVTMAPAFPDAAAMPCAVPRTRVGKTSTGMRLKRGVKELC
jgi:hypothetical protein